MDGERRKPGPPRGRLRGVVVRKGVELTEAQRAKLQKATALVAAGLILADELWREVDATPQQAPGGE